MFVLSPARWPKLLCTRSLCALIALLVSLVGTQFVQADDENRQAAGIAMFKEQVRLIFAHNCVSCHGGDAKESEFDLTTREGLLKGGYLGKAVVPGEPEASRLLRLIRHEDEPTMPEDDDKLTAEQIAAVERWIELGAPYDKPLFDPEEGRTDWTRREIDRETRQYWAFQPLRHVEPPAVADEEGIRNPIDRFIRARQQDASITPGEPADRRTLIRRAYFDLIGMPPNPEEVRAFLADESPDAYAKLIDRLLESPHYGERWGRHWLDVARFAESHGFEQDYNREFAYHFRDFVIKALNQDMPFDQFARWQIAGDEIAPEEPLAMMATGFLGAGVFPTQITKNEVERTRYDALDDMASTVGTAFLGLTVGCARCHDHKYDPIPSADYYRLISTFTTTVRSNIELNLDPEGYRQAKAEFDKQHAPLVAALKRFEKEELPQRLAEWEASRAPLEPATWLSLDFVEAKSAGGATLSPLEDGSLLASGENPKNDTYTFVAHTHLEDITAVRVEALAHKSFKKGGPGRAANGNFALSDFTVTAAPLAEPKKAKPVELAPAGSTFDQKALPATAAVDGDPKSAWAVDPQFGKDHAAVYTTESDVGFAGGTVLTFKFSFGNNVHHSIGRPRISITTAKPPVEVEGDPQPAAAVEILAIAAEKRTPEQQQRLLRWYRTRDPRWQELNRRVQVSLARAPEPETAMVMVTSEGFKPIRHHTQGADFFEKTYYLRRGDCENKVREAEPGFLQVLSRGAEEEAWQVAPPDGWRTSYRRRGLANWMTDTDHGAGHLMARVIANRLWHHHFGRGIVATPNDFGRQGKEPTHPALLDWLASELIRGAWRLKSLHKLIMTSGTYMQSSEFDQVDYAEDPENRLCWRFTPRRLEAEAIRDSMLAVTGTLDRRMYGPGTLDEGHNRRSIYFMIKRSKLIPMMQLFDAPEPLASTGRRPSTTVAPQALLFMNNPHVRRWVSNFAGVLQPAAEESLAAAVHEGYWRALAREPTAGEKRESVAFLQQQLDSYRAQGKPEALTLALTDFCQVLLSLNEFVYVE